MKTTEIRSRHSRVFYEKCVGKKFCKIDKKISRSKSVFYKTATSFKNRLLHSSFPVNYEDWNTLFRVDKIVEKKNQINKCIIQVLAHNNRYV